MRVSELCRRSGLPLSTVKFYIREGLLPPGESIASNQARYGERHVQRLELVGALRDVCGLSVDATRRVLRAVDDPGPEGPTRVVLQAMEPRAPERTEVPDETRARALAEVGQFLDGLDWSLPRQHEEHAERLADALLQMRRFIDPELSVDFLTPYARTAWALSEVEYESTPRGEPVQARPGDDLTYPTLMAILGTVLIEPILLTLRRYALYARGARSFRGLPLPVPEPIRADD